GNWKNDTDRHRVGVEGSRAVRPKGLEELGTLAEAGCRGREGERAVLRGTRLEGQEVRGEADEEVGVVERHGGRVRVRAGGDCRGRGCSRDVHRQKVSSVIDALVDVVGATGEAQRKRLVERLAQYGADIWHAGRLGRGCGRRARAGVEAQ